MKQPRRKRIALITPSLAKGGLEKVVVVGAGELEKAYEVTVIVMDTFRTDYPYEGRVIDLGLSWEDRRLCARLSNFVKAILRLHKLKREEAFDVVIGHGELASFPNVLSGGKHNVVVIHENRFAAQKDFQGRAVNRLLGLLIGAPGVSKIITVSEGIRQSLIERLSLDATRIVTIHNPYEVEHIRALSEESVGEFAMLFDHPVIVAAGRLILAKGQWYLLRIFAELKRRRPGLKLVILGEGVLQERLIGMAGRLGLHTYSCWNGHDFHDNYDVYFMGFQKNPFKFIAASKLFVMTSVWEGFGNTIVEAMACGTPVVSTDCPSGPGEIIRPGGEGVSGTAPDFDGYGVLMPTFPNRLIDETPPMSPEEICWVDTVMELLSDEKRLRHYVEQGVCRAEAFRPEPIMAAWRCVIDGIGDPAPETV